jgi:ferredoxin-nitrite reductase
MEKLFAAYMEKRNSEESFLDFSRRHSTAELQSFCTVKEQV